MVPRCYARSSTRSAAWTRRPSRSFAPRFGKLRPRTAPPSASTSRCLANYVTWRSLSSPRCRGSGTEPDTALGALMDALWQHPDDEDGVAEYRRLQAERVLLTNELRLLGR
jgi:hypothetical protein